MTCGIADRIFESAVSIINVEIVFLVEVIGNVNVRPSVIVNIGNSQSKSKAQHVIDNTCALRNITELSVVVLIELALELCSFLIFEINEHVIKAGIFRQ